MSFQRSEGAIISSKVKKVIITCDTCKKVLGDQHIRLGTQNGTDLYFENKLPTNPGEIQFIARYQDLHFCSREHFYQYFFNREELIKLKAK